MRSFSKKLAFVLAAAMVLTGFAPAAQAKAADDFSLNRTSYILYTSTESDNHHGSDKLADGLYGNVEKFDFNLKNAPADWATAYSYKWASSKEAVATVATGGLVTAKSVGTTEISCTITDKATGNTAAVLKATVTVKANAAELEIEAADGKDYDGVEVAPGATIDFNRTMADQDGNWSNVKGKYVTDETRWFVTPENKGVTVDQTNGVVTVGADADGEYTVYAETYQSTKYNAATATSNKVTFTVNAKSDFEITQKDLDTFEIAFTGKVTAADVDVVSVLPINGVEYEIPVYAKATLKDNVATVDLVNAVQNNQKFYFTVNGEKTPVTATIGAVKSIKVTADENQGPDYPVVVAGGDGTRLVATLYNAEGVNVTDYYLNANSQASVEFVEVTSTEEVAYMIQPDGLIWFEKAGALADIKVVFHTAVTDDNGDEVGNVEMPFRFGSAEAKKIQVEKIASSTIKINGNDTKKMSLPLNTEGATLVVKPLVTDVKAEDTPEFVVATEYTVNGTNYGEVRMEETNNNIFAIDRTNNAIYTFQEGKGKVVIYLVTLDDKGEEVKTPVGVVDIEVTKANKLDSVKLERTTATVGMVPGLDEDKIALVAKDYYKQDWKGAIGTVSVKAANTAAKNIDQADIDLAISYDDEAGKLVILGSLLEDAFKNSTTTSVNPQFTVTVDNGVDKWEQTLSVVVKKKITTATPGYVLEKSAGDWGEVSRVLNNTGDANNDAKLQDAKSITFTVYETNNTVKVDGAAAKMYVDKKDLTDADNGKLFIKVTKNGTDISNKGVKYVKYDTVNVANGNATATAVTINFSDVDTDGFVTYNETGAGSYSVVLYKANVKGNVKSYTTIKTITGSTTVNVGKYTFAGVKLSEATGSEAEDLRPCFNINGRNGQETTSTIIAMDATPSAASGTVFVRSFTFVEEFDGVKVAYKVDVNKAIKVK